MRYRRTMVAFSLLGASLALAQPAGEVRGSATQHTAASARAVIEQGWLVLPPSATGGAVYAGRWRDAPATTRRVPVVVFMHGSSGLGLKAIGEWQAWLAGLGVASFAPDSFALPERLTYKSPVAQEFYERIHALRLSEVELSVQALRTVPWADTGRMLLAGTSEGAVPVARYAGKEFAGRIIFSWSCEDNYFVRGHATALPAELPVLNVISASDPYFSASNPWLGNPTARGHCAQALKDSKNASIVLISGAPHTLINLPQARHATAGFIADVLKP